MKKHLLVLLTILLSTLMICACTNVPSSSTDSSVDDTLNSTNSDTNDSANDDSTSDGVGGNTNNDNTSDNVEDSTSDENKENDSEVGDGANDDANDNTLGDGTNNDANDNIDEGENNNADDSAGGDENDDLGNQGAQEEEEKPQVNIATQVNQLYYRRIYGRYKGDDFPEEHGCYYKVITSYEEFTELFSATEDVGRAFFNQYYAVIIYQHYETTSSFEFAGYRDFKGASITADCVNYPYIDYPQGSYIKDTKSCIAVPKSEILYNDDGIVREISIIKNFRDYYKFRTSMLSTEKTSDLYSGKAWLIKNSEELDELDEQYGIHHMRGYPLEDKGIYLLVIYSDVYTNRIGFNNFYTDGKNVYISCEIISTINLMLEESHTLYFVEIPKSIIEHEMSEEIVVHFLLQKTQNY